MRIKKMLEEAKSDAPLDAMLDCFITNHGETLKHGA